jgi:outer membrane protein OmpA-like peptidoglycan-associated protein
MHVRTILLGTALGLGLASGVAGAVERHGWYVGLEAGWVNVPDTELQTWGYSDIEFDSRWGGMGTVGHAFNGNWRLEFEAGYRNNDIDRINTVSVTDGELTEWSGFFNAHYDQPIGRRWAISFGAGAGVDSVRFDDTTSEDTDAVFAAQGILGLVYQVGPHWDVMLNYRYLWAMDPEFTDVSANTDNMEIAKHTVTLGFRYGYDAVAAPPPPPPAPPPAAPEPAKPKQFIIFFGFDKCDITAEADRVLGEASETAKSTGTAAVRIIGHTDTSGSPAYNQRLSECRSGAAKSNMVGKGIPEGAISTSGKGENDLMVQTGDGIKEPQNRRATVDLD